MQTEVLAERGSDCGSLRYLEITLTESNIGDYIYRYVKNGNGLTLIDNNNKNSFIGKTVKMRSPMYCVGIGKDKCMCNMCAGDFYYNLGKKNIGLIASKVATTLTQLGLQKFHQNLVVTKQIDPNDMLV